MPVNDRIWLHSFWEDRCMRSHTLVKVNWQLEFWRRIPTGQSHITYSALNFRWCKCVIQPVCSRKLEIRIWNSMKDPYLLLQLDTHIISSVHQWLQHIKLVLLGNQQYMFGFIFIYLFILHAHLSTNLLQSELLFTHLIEAKGVYF